MRQLFERWQDREPGPGAISDDEALTVVAWMFNVLAASPDETIAVTRETWMLLVDAAARGLKL